MYAIRYPSQEIVGGFLTVTVENMDAFLNGIVQVAQKRGKGWRHHVADISIDGDDVIITFTIVRTTPASE